MKSAYHPELYDCFIDCVTLSVICHITIDSHYCLHSKSIFPPIQSYQCFLYQKMKRILKNLTAHIFIYKPMLY